MKFNDALYVSMAAYSCIHPNRARALDHFFCVIGNGYDWVNGQLIDYEETQHPKLSPKQRINRIFKQRKKRHEIEEKERAAMEARIAKEERKPDPELDRIIRQAAETMRKAKEADPEGFERKCKEQEAAWAKQKAEWEESKKWDYAIPDNIEERMKDTSGWNSWYPMCQYSAMVDFPDDIQDDWLDAVIETAQLVLANPGTTKVYQQMQGDEVYNKVVANNIEIATKALERATKLKEKRLATQAGTSN